MANKSTKKSKKPLQTSLGKAVPNVEEKIDLSHVIKPIHTSIFGLSEVLSLHKTGTQEVINYIDNECELIYECRICHSLFRSIANFILHKREYCREQFSAILQYSRSFHKESSILHVPEENSNINTTFSNELNNTSSGNPRNTLASVITKLTEKKKIEEFSKRIINQDLSEDTDEISNRSTNSMPHDLLVEQIGSNNVAVFQTLLKNVPRKNKISTENMKSQVMEIHTIMGKDEAVLDSDGKLFSLQATDKFSTTCRTDLTCPECKLKFATRKTLTYHIKYKHTKTRRVFVCPDCKGHFANAWSVYRHLYKVHRRTASYIKRMREQINNSVISKEVEPVKKKEKIDSEKEDITDAENQWLNNIEGDKDFQMCGGCGKRFERKAALHSHAQMCIKRIAVCNSIKEHSAKRKEEENKDKSKVHKIEKVSSSDVFEALKGASKRKPYLLRTYKNRYISPTNNNDNSSDICDVNANSEVVEINCDISSEILTNSSFHKQEEIVDHITKSTESNLNNSDYSENFKGFSRECESAQTAIKLDQQSGPDPRNITNSKTGEWFPLSSLLSSVEKRNEISVEKTNEISDQFENKKSNLFIDNQMGVGGKHSKVKNMVINVTQEPFTKCTKVNGQISIRNIADLTGTSAAAKKNTSFKTQNNIPNDFKLSYKFDRAENISQTVSACKSNVSLDRKNEVQTCKRKRSISYDMLPTKKNLRKDKSKSLKDQDVNFIERAGPFMDKSKLLCKQCKKTYPTFARLLWHMSGHFSWFRFQCSRCSFISFRKSDCAKHAKVTHAIHPKDLQSVVLPIPNWKIVLMSHDFSDFNEENDLSGKHTDEVIIDECNEEESTMEEAKKSANSADCDNEHIMRTLFIDTEANEDISSKCLDFPQPIEDQNLSVKNEILHTDEEKRNGIIDIIEDTHESFLIKDIPQEMYDSNILDVFPKKIYVEDNEFSMCSTSTDEDLFKKYLIPKTKDIEIILMDEIKQEVVEPLEDNNISPHTILEGNDTNENVEERETFLTYDDSVNAHGDYDPVDLNSSTNSDYNNSPISFISTRPTRIRTRSIKTRHDDFFYELNKPFKPIELTNNKNNGNPKVRSKIS